MSLRNVVFLLALATTGSCSYEVSGPGYGEGAVLRVTVTGGLEPVSLRYRVDTEGDVTGMECETGCDFQPGEVLHHLTPAQQVAVLDAINRSGLPTAGHPVDFGAECCDRRSFWVIYESGTEIRSFSGALDALPEPLQDLVRLAESLYRSTPPVILSQDSGVAGFRTDAIRLERAAVDGDVLAVDLSYSGGCGVHDIDAVVSTDVTANDPAEVGMIVTHDAHGDACDALLERTVRFDMTPLRKAYQNAYDRSHGTVVLSLTPGADPAGAHTAEYTF